MTAMTGFDFLVQQGWELRRHPATAQLTGAPYVAAYAVRQYGVMASDIAFDYGGSSYGVRMWHPHDGGRPDARTLHEGGLDEVITVLLATPPPLAGLIDVTGRVDRDKLGDALHRGWTFADVAEQLNLTPRAVRALAGGWSR